MSDNDAKTLAVDVVPGVPALTAYEFSLNSGASYAPASSTAMLSAGRITLPVGNGDLAIGAVRIRVAEAGGAPAGEYASNATAFGVVVANRGLTFNGTNQYATLPAGTGALTGNSWVVELRVRSNQATGQWYVVDQNKWAIIAGFAGLNVYEMFIELGNGYARLPMPAVAPGSMNTMKWTYDGTTIRAFLNGTPAGTLTQALNITNAGFGLSLGATLTGTSPAAVTIDLLTIDLGAGLTIDLPLNETAPPYVNNGSDGGQLTLINNPTSEAL